MTVSFQVPEDGFDHQDAMPDVPAPEESLDVRRVIRRRGARDGRRLAGASGRRWTLRAIGDSRPGGRLPTTSTRRSARLWIRVSGRLDDDVLTHQAAFTYASDLTLLGSTPGAARRPDRQPARAGRLAGPHDLVPPAVPGRRVAALRPGVAVGLAVPAAWRSAGCSPRTAGWSPPSPRRG